ncbi:hypothetical protein A2Z10_01705 [Candidatus Azambacteria bacterium RBG_16_47_10]|uniref:Uncharacterized protein n=1 Tax=Candidatus Azambacteria bacterium RBG_16_47_10 TaxID=1797292 RepID=A0A1F5B154_9BACT|nr:MAG: hypothetical protein A2Z10_01705 [Candidatus Azambacteria bacterium RBG_16_47_10]
MRRLVFAVGYCLAHEVRTHLESVSAHFPVVPRMYHALSQGSASPHPALRRNKKRPRACRTQKR